MPAGAPLPEKIRLRHDAVQAFLLSLADRATLAEALERAELAWGEVRSSSAALDSPTARARGSVVSIDDRAGGSRRVIQSPYRFSASASGATGRAPYRGEHNADVLSRWLSMSEAEIASFETAGVLLKETR